MIYLDNSATTQPCEACVRAMTELLTDCWGNPSSVHAHGIAAHHRLRQAREQVASALGAEPDRVFFTSGGTEADNWALRGVCEALKDKGKHVIITKIEHAFTSRLIVFIHSTHPPAIGVVGTHKRNRISNFVGFDCLNRIGYCLSTCCLSATRYGVKGDDGCHGHYCTYYHFALIRFLFFLIYR